MAFSKQELEKIREDLPWGSSKRLAEKFNITPGHVRNILSGSANNDEVVLAAYYLGQEHQGKVVDTKTALAHE